MRSKLDKKNKSLAPNAQKLYAHRPFSDNTQMNTIEYMPLIVYLQ